MKTWDYQFTSKVGGTGDLKKWGGGILVMGDLNYFFAAGSFWQKVIFHWFVFKLNKVIVAFDSIHMFFSVQRFNSPFRKSDAKHANVE